MSQTKTPHWVASIPAENFTRILCGRPFSITFFFALATFVCLALFNGQSRTKKNKKNMLTTVDVFFKVNGIMG